MGTHPIGAEAHTAPQWDRSAVVVIDVQHDFVDPHGAMPVPGTAATLDAIGKVLAAARRAGRPIVHVVRLYVSGGSDTDLPRRAAIEGGARIVVPGSAGSQIPDGLLPRKVELDADLLLAGKTQDVTTDEVVMYKPRWSAFHRTALHRWLHERDITTVVVLGCNLPNCPRATLFDASNHDYRTVLVTDATSQSTPPRLEDLTLIGTNLLSAEQVVNALVR